MKRKLTTLLIAVFVILGMLPVDTLPAYATASNGDTILAFSSDVHNEPKGESAARLGDWIDTVNREVQGTGIDFMTFCGDLGMSSNERKNNERAGEVIDTGYWDWVASVMAVVDNKLGADKSAYTTGNHDIKIDDGNLDPDASYSPDIPQGRFSIDKKVAGGPGLPYEIYCMGSRSKNQSGDYINEYTNAQVNALSSWLNGCNDTGKIYIIATHFPLHYYKRENSSSSRTTGNAYNVIQKINAAANGGTPNDPSDDKTIVFLWGHNHSLSDKNYNKVYKPGDPLQYTSSASDKSVINFWYAPAGCMADSEDSGGSAGTIAPKALMLRIPNDGSPCNFTYYNKDMGKIGSAIPMVINVTGVKLNKNELTLEAGNTEKLSAAVTPMNASDNSVVWTSSDDSTATVGNDGTVKAIKAGTVIITARASENSSIYDKCTVTITEEGSKEISDPKMPKVTIKKPSAGKQAFTAKWKKLSNNKQNKVKKIEILVATDKYFTKGKVIKTAGKSKSARKIRGLRKKCTYYVKVRTYRESNGIKYVGAWSKTRKIRTR